MAGGSFSGGLQPGQLAEIRGWLQAHGVTLPDMQAETVERALERTDLPAHCYRVLEIKRLRPLAGRSARPRASHHFGRTHYIGGNPKASRFDSKRNRHTGGPHLHAREIERAARQAERIAANRRARYVRAAERYGYDGPLAGDIGETRRGRRVEIC